MAVTYQSTSSIKSVPDARRGKPASPELYDTPVVRVPAPPLSAIGAFSPPSQPFSYADPLDAYQTTLYLLDGGLWPYVPASTISHLFTQYTIHISGISGRRPLLAMLSSGFLQLYCKQLVLDPASIFIHRHVTVHSPGAS